MRKVFFVILLVIISMSVYGLTERSLFNASGQGSSTFITADNEDQIMIYMFTGTRSGNIHYRGAIVYVDEEMQPEGVIHFKWYTHRGNLVIEPHLMEVYENGEIVAEREGYNNIIRDSVSLFRHDGHTMLTIGEVRLLLMN